MVAAIRLTFLLVLVACTASARLDLTPQDGEKELEGVKLKQLVFFDNGQRITYSPPRRWKASGASSRLVLRPEGTDAEAVIRVFELSGPQTFDAATTKRLSEEALAALPRGVTHESILSVENNPVVIEQKETFLVVLRYQFYGIVYQRSVMFLNRKNEQLQFQLTAPETNFPQLHKQFLSSQFSWENL